MTHYSIALLTPTSEEWIPGYINAVGPLLTEHGGRYVSRTAGYERLEGDDAPAMVVVIEWPSQQAERAFFNDPRYAPHRAARQGGAATRVFSVPATDDLA